MTLGLEAVATTVRGWWGWLWQRRQRAPISDPATPLPPVLARVNDDDDDIVEVCDPVEAEECALSVVEEYVDDPRVEEEHSTRWYLRGQLLDRLDEYFFCVRQVRRHDPHAYGLFSRIGFAIPADVFANPYHPHFSIVPPAGTAFGGCLYPNSKRADSVHPSFVYFEKIERPTRVQRFTDGPVYRLTALYDDRKRDARWHTKLTARGTCHIGVHATTGAMTLLREATTTQRAITTGTRNRRRRRETLWMTIESWQVPSWLYLRKSEDGLTAEEWATWLLRCVFHTYASATQKIVIRVKHGGCCASFGIDVARAKVFFKDRSETAVAADGKRKRIFHAVRQHVRQLSTGATEVRFHYRGLRSFDWNGYAVHIVWPTVTDVLAFGEPGKYVEDVEKADRHKYASMGKVGDSFAAVLER
jgi:hypothetical protein